MRFSVVTVLFLSLASCAQYQKGNHVPLEYFEEATPAEVVARVTEIKDKPFDWFRALFEKLKEGGKNLDRAVDPVTGDTFLHLAVRIGSVEMARALIRAGVDVSAPNKAKKTAIHLITELPCSKPLKNLFSIFTGASEELSDESVVDIADSDDNDDDAINEIGTQAARFRRVDEGNGGVGSTAVALTSGTAHPPPARRIRAIHNTTRPRPIAAANSQTTAGAQQVSQTRPAACSNCGNPNCSNANPTQKQQLQGPILNAQTANIRTLLASNAISVGVFDQIETLSQNLSLLNSTVRAVSHQFPILRFAYRDGPLLKPTTDVRLQITEIDRRFAQIQTSMNNIASQTSIFISPQRSEAAPASQIHKTCNLIAQVRGEIQAVLLELADLKRKIESATGKTIQIQPRSQGHPSPRIQMQVIVNPQDQSQSRLRLYFYSEGQPAPSSSSNIQSQANPLTTTSQIQAQPLRTAPQVAQPQPRPLTTFSANRPVQFQLQPAALPYNPQPQQPPTFNSQPQIQFAPNSPYLPNPTSFYNSTRSHQVLSFNSISNYPLSQILPRPNNIDIIQPAQVQQIYNHHNSQYQAPISQSQPLAQLQVQPQVHPQDQLNVDSNQLQFQPFISEPQPQVLTNQKNQAPALLNPISSNDSAYELLTDPKIYSPIDKKYSEVPENLDIGLLKDLLDEQEEQAPYVKRDRPPTPNPPLPSFQFTFPGYIPMAQNADNANIENFIVL